jgi:hypothetical protein
MSRMHQQNNTVVGLSQQAWCEIGLNHRRYLTCADATLVLCHDTFVRLDSTQAARYEGMTNTTTFGMETAIRSIGSHLLPGGRTSTVNPTWFLSAIQDRYPDLYSLFTKPTINCLFMLSMRYIRPLLNFQLTFSLFNLFSTLCDSLSQLRPLFSREHL